MNGYWWQGERYHRDLVLIEIATGNRKVILSDPDADFHSPSFAPDGRSLACGRSAHDTEDGPGDATLVLVSLDSSGEAVDLPPAFDLQPGGAQWGPGGRYAYICADQDGRPPVLRADGARREAPRVTADDGHYSEVAVSPDGTALYALRDAVGEPPTPVRIDPATGAYQRLPAPGQQPARPGPRTKASPAADDGDASRAGPADPAAPPTR